MDDSKKKRILRYRKHLFYLALYFLGLFLLALYDFIPRSPYFWFDGLPGFYAVFGLVSCLLIIVICKALGKHWLMVKENYYDVNGTAKKEMNLRKIFKQLLEMPRLQSVRLWREDFR